ncbi:MAG: hypothetical protein HY040_23185 [Planctomycetes bacterium]|nr:hypothetical protein [Planctomycetota bacterium]
MPNSIGTQHHLVMGPFLIAVTIWLSVVCCLAAYLGMLGYFRRGVRWLWTISWFFFILHFLAAFHFFHHWSQDHAYEHTEAESGFGPGLYITYLFAIAWTADGVWWWLYPRNHATRPRWLTLCLHTFLLFIIFNGAVVFTDGMARLAGIAMFVALGLGWVFKHLSPKR